MRRKKKLAGILNRPLLAQTYIPVLAVALTGFICLIVWLPGVRLPRHGNAGNAVLLEEPPEWGRDNAAFYYQKAYIKTLQLVQESRAGWTEEVLLKEAQPAIDLFVRGTRSEKCDFTFDGKVKFATTFRKAFSKVYLCEIIVLKARVLLKEGRGDDALELYRKFFVYLAQLSAQTDVAAATELIEAKRIAGEGLRLVIESGTLSGCQERTLLLLLTEGERSQVPVSAILRATGEKMKAALSFMPPEVFSRYEQISNGYFGRLAAALDVIAPDLMEIAAEKRVSSAGSDAMLRKMSRLVMARSAIDRELAMNYAASQKRNPGIYTDLAHSVFSTVCPDFTALCGEYCIAAAQWDLVKVALAARVYKGENDRYPESIVQLVPRYLSAIPKDPFGAGTFGTATDGETLTIFSSGRSRKSGGMLKITVGARQR